MGKAQGSIEQVMANLESQAAYFREREAFHAGHEAYHREQRAKFGAELAEINRRLEAFRASAAEAMEWATRQTPPLAKQQVLQADLGSASSPKVGRMAKMLIAEKGPDEPFGSVGLTQEINERFKERLARPATVPQLSIILRRLHRLKQIHQVRRGRPYWGALYVKEAPAA
jgi:hypothetical protein